MTKNKTGLSEILFALRMNPSATKKPPYDRYTEQEPNTIKRILTNKNRFISEQPEFELSGNNFESGQDSTIMVRERSRGSKLEGTFKNRKQSKIAITRYHFYQQVEHNQKSSQKRRGTNTR